MIQNHETSPKQSFQVLPNNRIDKEIRELVRSFNFPLGILLSSKYKIRNNHIYPFQNKCFFFLSFCRMLFFNSMCFYRMYSTLSTNVFAKFVNSVSAQDFTLIFVLILFTLQHSFSFTMLFILDVVHSNNNVSFILNIQTIHKKIDFRKSFPTYIIWNWISIFITITADISVFTTFYSSFSYMSAVVDFLIMFTDWSFFAFDINLMIATRVIVLLRKYIEEWIGDVQKMNDNHDIDELYCHKMFETYQDILETYNLYKTLFHILVSLCLF